MGLGFIALSKIAESATKSKTLSVIHLSRNGMANGEKKLLSKIFRIPESDLDFAEEQREYNADLSSLVKDDKQFNVAAEVRF